jgi:hypothetical protein
MVMERIASQKYQLHCHFLSLPTAPDEGSSEGEGSAAESDDEASSLRPQGDASQDDTTSHGISEESANVNIDNPSAVQNGETDANFEDSVGTNRFLPSLTDDFSEDHMMGTNGHNASKPRLSLEADENTPGNIRREALIPGLPITIESVDRGENFEIVHRNHHLDSMHQDPAGNTQSLNNPIHDYNYPEINEGSYSQEQANDRGGRVAPPGSRRISRVRQQCTESVQKSSGTTPEDNDEHGNGHIPVRTRNDFRLKRGALLPNGVNLANIGRGSFLGTVRRRR